MKSVKKKIYIYTYIDFISVIMKTWMSASAWNSLVAKMNDNELLTFPVCCSFVNVSHWHCLYTTFMKMSKHLITCENHSRYFLMWTLKTQLSIGLIDLNWLSSHRNESFQRWVKTFSHVNYTPICKLTRIYTVFFCSTDRSKHFATCHIHSLPCTFIHWRQRRWPAHQD